MKVYDDINNCWVSHRHLPEYHTRKRMVRDAWISGAILMLFLPINIVFAVALFGCFLSFMFLDEKPYDLSTVQVLGE